MRSQLRRLRGSVHSANDGRIGDKIFNDLPPVDLFCVVSTSNRPAVAASVYDAGPLQQLISRLQ